MSLKCEFNSDSRLTCIINFELNHVTTASTSDLDLSISSEPCTFSWDDRAGGQFIARKQWGTSETRIGRKRCGRHGIIYMPSKSLGGRYSGRFFRSSHGTHFSRNCRNTHGQLPPSSYLSPTATTNLKFPFYLVGAQENLKNPGSALKWRGRSVIRYEDDNGCVYNRIKGLHR
jgi:hypothetical protein